MPPKNTRLATLQRAKRDSKEHSSRIRLLRSLTPLLALVVLGGLFAWPFLEKSFYVPAPEEKKIVEESVIQNTLVKPKLDAFDGQGRPYRLAAEVAHQKEEDKADLEVPQGQILLKDGTVLTVSSQAGQYDKSTQSLDYENKVCVDTSTGYHLETGAAHVNLKDCYASGHQALSGRGPVGEISSEQGFVAEKDKLHLLGPSKLVISHPKAP